MLRKSVEADISLGKLLSNEDDDDKPRRRGVEGRNVLLH